MSGVYDFADPEPRGTWPTLSPSLKDEPKWRQLVWRPRSSATADASPDLISLARRAMADPEQRITLIGAIGCLGLLGLIFWSNLSISSVCG